MPDQYKQIEEIAKYNIENGTHFYKMDQVIEHQKAKSRLQQSQAIYDEVANDPFSIGDDVRAAYIGAGKRPETVEDQKKIDEWDASAKATNIAGLGAISMLPLAGEFTTYGLLGGGARVAGGFAGSALGSYGLGKAGDYADSKLGTNWIGNTGRIVGGFAGWGPGMNAGYKGALDLAAEFPTIAKVGATNRFVGDAAGRMLNTNVRSSKLFNPEFVDNQLYNFLKAELTDPTQLVHVSPNLITESRFVANSNAAKMGSGVEHLAAHIKGLDWVPGTSSNSAVNGQNKVWTFKGKPYRISPRDNTYIQIKQVSIPTEVTPQLDAFAHDRIPLSDASKIYQRNPVTGWVDRVIVEPTPKSQPQQVKIPGTPFYREVVPGSKPISEAEKLGIPKGMRSNPKALEDVYYWGYPQWNQRYNAAVQAGNIEEAQRLRDLHFKVKAPNAPQYNFYHGTFNKDAPFYIFEPQSNNELFFHFSPYKDTAEKFMGIAKTRNENGRLITAKLNIQRPTTVIDSGWWNWYRIPDANPRISKKLGMDGPTAGQYYSDLLLKEPSVSEANGKIMDMLGNDALMYKNYTEDTGRISVAIPRPSQIKLADPITKTDAGEIIPIVKRDNFHNLDIRYKQGGILKAQNGIPKSAKTQAYLSGLKDYVFHTNKSFKKSNYRPTFGEGINHDYYTRDGLKEEVALNLFGGTDASAKNLGNNVFYNDFNEAYNKIKSSSTNLEPRQASNGTLGRYVVSAGEDENGRYLSFTDKFDHEIIPGKAIPIYDRIYENEWEQLYNPERGALHEGDWLTRAPLHKKILNKNPSLRKQGGILKVQKEELYENTKISKPCRQNRRGC